MPQEGAGLLDVCETKLKELEDEVDSLKSQLSTATKAAEAAAKQSDTDRTALKTSLSEAEKEIIELKKKALTLEKKLLQARENSGLVDSEVSQLRRRIEEADRALKELSAHHTSAWLPHWIEQRVSRILQETRHAARAGVRQGQAAALQVYNLSVFVWKTHAYPMFETVLKALREKTLALSQTAGVFLADRGIAWPASFAANLQASLKTVKAAWRSKTANRLKSGIANGFVTLVDNYHMVIAELQQVIVKLARQYSWMESLSDPTLAKCAAYIIACE